MRFRHRLVVFTSLLFCSTPLLAGARHRDHHPPADTDPVREFRSIEGTGNNLAHPEWGSLGMELLRKTRVGYGDGQASPSGADRPGARRVSNRVARQYFPVPNASRASDMLWQWGQFLDHDIDLTEADTGERFDVPVPRFDPWFDPNGTGTQTIRLERSRHRTVGGIRQQLNGITAWIDGSTVYGSDLERATALREMDGTGRLKTSPGDLLPFNVQGLPNAPTSQDASFFLAGDVRANEQSGLTAMHTLFVREHNWWVDRLSRFRPYSGELLYQLARMIVIAEIQSITYNEFLPALLGPDALSPYQGYREEVNPGIANVFSTAAYRFGHSMLSSRLLRIGEDGREIPAGHLSLAEAFFHPEIIIDDGIEPILRGLAAQQAQEIDLYLVDEVRNFLFGAPGAGGFDLAALNVQRGRDHGLPSYNDVRADFGLAPVASFEEITHDLEVRIALKSGYGTVDRLDPWIGGLAEPHLPGALVGETWQAILVDQFERLRDGDRFFYRSASPGLVGLVEQQTLATIIRRNTGIGFEIGDDVFRAQDIFPDELPDEPY